MTKLQYYKKKTHNYLFDHRVLKTFLEYASSLLVCAFSALIFAFGFSTFAKGIGNNMSIITGGASGIGQSIRMIIELFVDPNNKYLTGVLVESIFYSVVNIPLIIFAFKKIGVRFAFLTLVNVVLTSVFMYGIKENSILQSIASDPSIASEPFARALIAGTCTGLSSAIAFKGYFSTGGLDIIGYYISLKKSSNTGKYSAMLNTINITVYTALFIGSINKNPDFYDNRSWTEAIASLIYGLVYLFAVMIVVDLINVRNKKVQVQIVTKNQHLSDVLIANLPHTVTIMKAVGGYTKADCFVLTMTVSSFELKKVVKIIKTADPEAFVQALSLHQVYGRFYMNPIK